MAVVDAVDAEAEEAQELLLVPLEVRERATLWNPGGGKGGWQ